MYDLRLLRDNLDGLRERLGPRGKDVAWEELRKLTEDRRTRTIEVEDLRHHLKTGSDEVARLKREKQPAEAAMVAMKALGDTIKGQEEQLRLIEEQLSHIALRIPNLPHESVPTGQDAAQNVEVRRWGSPPTLSAPAQSHWDLGEALGILDFDRAVRMAKARFAVKPNFRQ